MPVQKNASGPERGPAPDYDGHYKLMFGDPVMVRDLLRAFAPPDMVLIQGFPPLLPIMIYSGPVEWPGEEEVADLFMPMDEALEPYSPHQRYLPVKVRALTAEELARGEARGGLNMLVSLVHDGLLQPAAAAARANMSEEEFKARMREREQAGQS